MDVPGPKRNAHWLIGRDALVEENERAFIAINGNLYWRSLAANSLKKQEKTAKQEKHSTTVGMRGNHIRPVLYEKFGEYLDWSG